MGFNSAFKGLRNLESLVVYELRCCGSQLPWYLHSFQSCVTYREKSAITMLFIFSTNTMCIVLPLIDKIEQRNVH